MKKVFFISAMLLSINTFAQHRKGEVLRNEITQTYREAIGMNAPIHNENAEILITTEDAKYKIIVDDQIIENLKGLFHFYRLKEGWHSLSIYHENILIYRTKVYTKENHRLLLQYHTHSNLFVIGETPIPYQNSPIIKHYYGKIMNDEQFSEFLKYYKDQSFDDGKIDVLKYKKKIHWFTAQQIADLVKQLSFPKNQKSLAKELYPQCIDPENYLKVIETFSFISDKKEIQEYINNLP